MLPPVPAGTWPPPQRVSGLPVASTRCARFSGGPRKRQLRAMAQGGAKDQDEEDLGFWNTRMLGERMIVSSSSWSVEQGRRFADEYGRVHAHPPSTSYLDRHPSLFASSTGAESVLLA
jgi:hypothetical protein